MGGGLDWDLAGHLEGRGSGLLRLARTGSFTAHDTQLQQGNCTFRCDYYVIEQWYTDGCAGNVEFRRHGQIGVARRRIATRMIVDDYDCACAVAQRRAKYVFGSQCATMLSALSDTSTTAHIVATIQTEKPDLFVIQVEESRTGPGDYRFG